MRCFLMTWLRYMACCLYLNSCKCAKMLISSSLCHPNYRFSDIVDVATAPLVSLFTPLIVFSELLSCIVRKSSFCKCKNKDADQLCGNHAADLRLCFRNRDKTIHILPQSEISSLESSSVVLQPSLCQIWS